MSGFSGLSGSGEILNKSKDEDEDEFEFERKTGFYLNPLNPLPHLLPLGSSASRKPSPRKFNARREKDIVKAGKTSSHQ
jgi:hypothetical protein